MSESVSEQMRKVYAAQQRQAGERRDRFAADAHIQNI
jgi:hypothetical protein